MSERENPLVYAVKDGEIDEFIDGSMTSAFSSEPMRLRYLQFWRDLSRPTPINQDDTASTLSEAAEDELADLLLAAQEGNILAVLDSLLFFRDHGMPPSSFLIECASGALSGAIRGQSLGQKGRGGNPFAKLSSEAKDQWRVSTVKKIRRAQSHVSELGLQSLVVALMLPAETYNLVLQETLQSIGSTMEDAFEIATLSLRGTPAACSREWLEKVFYKAANSEARGYQPSKELMDLFSVDQETTAWPFSHGPNESLYSLEDYLEMHVPEVK